MIGPRAEADVRRRELRSPGNAVLVPQTSSSRSANSPPMASPHGFAPHKKLPSIYLWPRGLFVFNVDFSALLQHHSLADVNLNTVRIASHLLAYHAYHHKSTSISYGQWYRIASSKIGLSDEVAFAFFSAAQITDESIDDAQRLRGFSRRGASSPDSRVSLLHLVLLICINGATQSDSRGSRDVLLRRFITKHIDQICRLTVLCHESYLGLIDSPRDLPQIPLNKRISPEVLRNFDVFFEGAIGNFEEDSVGAKALPASVLALRYWTDGEGIVYNFLVRRIQSVLQTDPFQIGAFEKTETFDVKFGSQQTATPAADPSHRSVTIRNLASVRLVDKDYYVGSNLRIEGGEAEALNIALRPFKTAAISNCVGRGKILLGRVDDTMYVRNVHDYCISAICRRIVVDGCTNVRFFLNSLVSPVIMGNCSEIVIGPYNVFDESVTDNLRPLEENLFDQAVELQGFYASGESVSSTPLIPLAERMPVNQFYIQPTPFTNTANYQEALKRFEATVPKEYLESWRVRREDAAEALQAGFAARSPSLTEKDKKRLLRKARPKAKRTI